jgi:hypothetical protein
VGFRCKLQQAIHGNRLVNHLRLTLKKGTLPTVLTVVLIKPVLFVRFDRVASCAVVAILAASDLQSRQPRPFDLALLSLRS